MDKIYILWFPNCVPKCPRVLGLPHREAWSIINSEGHVGIVDIFWALLELLATGSS